MLAQANEAFRRDFPELWPAQDRRWVLYHGDERIDIQDSPVPLYEECKRRGWRQDEYLVECILPEPDPLDLGMFLGK
jgi:hypothetical protein